MCLWARRIQSSDLGFFLVFFFTFKEGLHRKTSASSDGSSHSLFFFFGKCHEALLTRTVLLRLAAALQIIVFIAVGRESVSLFGFAIPESFFFFF
jgi:hypothetical protein